MGPVRLAPPHRLRPLAARLICVVLLVQFLLPAGLAPPRLALAGADGTPLPTAFCALARAAGDALPHDQRDRHGHDHCVLCRLPGLAGLGAGIVDPPALAVPRSWQRISLAAPAVVRPCRPTIQAFAARAPPVPAIA
jgi:hypothetical protein